LQSQGNNNEKQINIPLKIERKKKEKKEEKQSLMRTIKKEKRSCFDMHDLPKQSAGNNHVA
jgi:hypothetical protein